MPSPRVHTAEEGLVPSTHEEQTPILSDSLQSVLESWPVQLCIKCAVMTGTEEGLRDLLSSSGYKHHTFEEFGESVKTGCNFCREIDNELSWRQWPENWIVFRGSSKTKSPYDWHDPIGELLNSLVLFVKPRKGVSNSASSFRVSIGNEEPECSVSINGTCTSFANSGRKLTSRRE